MFLDIFKRPSLISFDKYANKELLSYCMKITDICCEYCLKGMLDELFLTNGVISAFMEYDDIVQYLKKKGYTSETINNIEE